MRVAILYGGRTFEHEESVTSGVAVARAAAGRGHDVRLIDPAADGLRHALIRGSTLAQLVCADLVFPVVHGGWGGDGHLQAVLELAGVPFTGAGSAACALAWNKPWTLAVLRSAGVPTPSCGAWQHGHTDPPDAVWRLVERGPVVVKEAVGTSHRTLQVAATPAQLREACEIAHDGELLVVTPFLPGREFTVAVVGPDVLPVAEIRIGQALLDYHTKVRGGADLRCPAELPSALARDLVRYAATAHQALGLGDRAYSLVDFRCDAAGQPLCLEVDACPSLRPGSAFAMAARGAGWSYPDLVEKIMDMAVAPAPRVAASATLARSGERG